MLELSCLAVNVLQLLDVRMSAVVPDDPKMETEDLDRQYSYC